METNLHHAAFPATISYAATRDQGGRPYQQDEFIVIPNILGDYLSFSAPSVSSSYPKQDRKERDGGDSGDSRKSAKSNDSTTVTSLLIAVFDGHGSEGGVCAGHLKSQIPKIFERYSQKFTADPTSAFNSIVTNLNETVHEHCDTYLSGSTCTMAVLWIEPQSPNSKTGPLEGHPIAVSNNTSSPTKSTGTHISAMSEALRSSLQKLKSSSASNVNLSGPSGDNGAPPCSSAPFTYKLAVAHLGDGRCVIGKKVEKPGSADVPIKAVQLTTDHTLRHPEELSRVLAAPGVRIEKYQVDAASPKPIRKSHNPNIGSTENVVKSGDQKSPSVSPEPMPQPNSAPRNSSKNTSEPTGSEESDDEPLRIFKGSLPYPGLIPTRTLGDSVAQRLGVIAVPEVKIMSLQPLHANLGDSLDSDSPMFKFRKDAADNSPGVYYLVLATDGVWDGMSVDDVGSVVAKYIESEQSKDVTESSPSGMNNVSLHQGNNSVLSATPKTAWTSGVSSESSRPQPSRTTTIDSTNNDLGQRKLDNGANMPKRLSRTDTDTCTEIATMSKSSLTAQPTAKFTGNNNKSSNGNINSNNTPNNKDSSKTKNPAKSISSRIVRRALRGLDQRGISDNLTCVVVLF